MSDDDDDQAYREFTDAVNMGPKELQTWLATDESRKVGQKRGSESVGHRSGRRIVGLLNTKTADLSADDYRHMRKVVGYLRRHLAQRPEGDITQTDWRYSLMNWGHDPKK